VTERVPPPTTDEEIAETMRALDELATADETADPVSVAGLRHSVLHELRRRLGDPELVKELPGTGLLQLARELLKEKFAEPEALPPHPSVREIVEAVTLPAARKQELLMAERTWLIEEVDRVDAALLKLEDA
jgi:hypothetical protein